MSQNIRIATLVSPDLLNGEAMVAHVGAIGLATPHKFWRVKVNSVNGGTTAAIGTIRLFDKANAAVDLLEGNVSNVTASSYTAGYLPSGVVDDDIYSTQWRSAGSQHIGSWVAIETLNPITANGLSIGLPSGIKTYWPTSITVAYSDDGYGWVEFGTWAVDVATPTTGNASRFFDLADTGAVASIYDAGAASGAHQYWRLLITANGGDTYYTVIDDLRFHSDICTAVDHTGAVAYASSEAAGYPASGVLSDTLASYWQAPIYDVGEAYIAVQFPAAVDVTAVYLKCSGSLQGADANPTAARLQYSDDGVSWYTRASLSFVWTGVTEQTKGLVIDGVYTGCASVTLPALTVSAESSNISGSVTLPFFEVAASGDNSWMELPVPEVTATGAAGNITSVLQEPLDLPAPSVTGEALTGGLATGAIDLPPLTVAALAGGDTDITLPAVSLVAQGEAGIVASADLTLPAPAVESQGETQGAAAADLWIPGLVVEASGLTGNAGSMTATLAALALAAEGATGEVGTATLTLPVIEVDAAGVEEVVGAAVITLPALYVEATGGARVDGSTANTGGYALNLLTKALTQYQATPFNSFAAFNGVYLGATADGIYLLEGSADGTAAIAASYKTGALGMGSDQLKRLSRAYVSYRTDGELILSAIYDEGDQADYVLSQTGQAGVHQHRLKLGRGVKGKYIALRVQNVAGADFDIDAIDLDGIVTSRRV